MHVDKDIMQKN